MTTLERQLAALDPRAVLGRGYAVVTDPASDEVVASAAEVHAGQPLRVTVADGEFAAVVGERNAGDDRRTGSRANGAGTRTIAVSP